MACALVKSQGDLITFVIQCMLIPVRPLAVEQQMQGSRRVGSTPGSVSAAVTGKLDLVPFQVLSGLRDLEELTI